MYQLKYTDGMEIHITGDLCKVTNSEGKVEFVGNYEQCKKWLEARGCRPIY